MAIGNAVIGKVAIASSRIANPIIGYSGIAGNAGSVRYVDSVSGLDANNGLTPATPWQTPAKVAATTLPTNTTVYFKRGSTFNSIYTPAQAGIKHDAYGSGANPVFDASVGIATTWTPGPGAAAQESTPPGFFASGMETTGFSDWTSIDTTGVASITRVSSPPPAHGTYCMQMLANGTANDNRGGLTKTITALAANSTTYVRAYVYIPTGSMGSSGQLKIFNIGSDWVSLNWNGSAFTGMSIVMGAGAVFVNTFAGSFALDTWNYVEVELTVSSTVGGAQCWINGTSIGSDFTHNTSASAGETSFELGNTNFGPILSANKPIYFDDCKLSNTGPIGAFSAGLPTTTWSTPLASAPLMPVFPTGTQAIAAASAAAIAGSGQWYWDGSTTLYVYSASNPGTTIGLPTNDSAINVNAIQNLSFNNLTVRGAKGIGGLKLAGNFSGLSLLSGFLAESCYQDGVSALENTALIQNVSFNGATFRYNGASGFQLNVSFQLNNYFGYNRAYGNSLIQNSATSNLAFSAGLHWYSANANSNGNTAANAGQGTIVEHNWAYNNGPGSTGQQWGNGIHCDTVNGMIVRYNNVYGNISDGIKIEKNGSTLVYFNNVWNNASIQYQANISLICSGGQNESSCQVFNNTCYGGYWGLNASPYEGGGTSRFDSNAFTNNISSGATAGQNLNVGTVADNSTGNGSGNTYTYNCLGTAASGFVQYGATGCSTYAAFDTAYGSATHSVQGNPLYNNPASNDFSLQVGSPCLGASIAVAGYVAAGTNLGSNFAAST